MVISRSDVANTLASGGGAVLAAAFHAAGRLRPTAKPLHPRGRVVHGTLRRVGLDPVTGVPWLDQPGVDRVVVRLSRAMGLPVPLPDIHGMAVRVPVGPSRHGDLLFATTGTGWLTRYALTLARSPERQPQTTLMPYRAPGGAVLLAVFPRGAGRYEFAVSQGGKWRIFGALDLDDDSALGSDADPTISFDPVLNTVPGLEPYEWVCRLREGAYAQARRTR